MAQRLVADSSVALKWWLDDEQFVDEARIILNKIVAKDLELVVPELWLYDISYMVIAEIENIPLITGDEKFFNTIKGNKSFVKYLSDLESSKKIY